MKTVSLLNSTTFVIRFTYDPATVAQVRCLPMGRKWVPEIKAWTCPASVDALESLRGWGFETDSKVVTWERLFLSPSKPSNQPITDISGLKGVLRPFQAEGVGFLESRGGRALIGDEMGLGKTIEALAWLQYKGPPALPAVVICPASLKENWARECRTWTTLTPCVLSGTTPYIPECWERRESVYIINYDVLGPWIELLNRVCSTVILDECHMLKNAKTKRTHAVKTLCKKRNHIIALSGTPIINRPIEFFNVLNLIAPNTFPKYWDYAQRYCDATHNGFGWDLSGASNTDELYNKVNGTIMIRRLKKDVLKELPDKTRTALSLQLSSTWEAYYEASLLEALGEFANNESRDKPDPLRDITQINKLRYAAMEAKFDLCCEWIDNFLETERKLVVFVIHHKTTDQLMAKYKGLAVPLDGRTDSRLRSTVVQEFQTNPKIKLLIGNVQVAGVGHTLTAAQDAIFIEFPWTPGELSQAEDRIHRIGQKNAVNIYYLVAKGTLEEDMLELINEKQKVLDGVLDGIFDDKETNIINEILKRLKTKKEKKW